MSAPLLLPLLMNFTMAYSTNQYCPLYTEPVPLSPNYFWNHMGGKLLTFKQALQTEVHFPTHIFSKTVSTFALAQLWVTEKGSQKNQQIWSKSGSAQPEKFHPYVFCCCFWRLKGASISVSSIPYVCWWFSNFWSRFVVCQGDIFEWVPRIEWFKREALQVGLGAVVWLTKKRTN